MTFSTKAIKADFPILHKKINGKDLVYLDNAATTQKPTQVIKAITNYYENDNANVHRSIHTLASRASIAYENAHKTVAKFINAKPQEIIFTRGTTDGLNKIARSLSRSKIFKDGDEILISEMEHHANIVPWQEIIKDLKKQNINVTLKWIPVNEDFTLNTESLPNLITEKTKVLSIMHISNVLGTINPIKDIINTAKGLNKDIITIVDAAQSAVHIPLDVKQINCDVLVFSGHKLLGPTGIGVLFGKTKLLESIEPFNFGGDMINSVTKDQSTWNELPYKFEAGTPSVAQAVGLAAAIDYLNSSAVGGMQAIKEHSDQQTEHLLTQLQTIPKIKIIGLQTPKNRTSVVSFTIEGIHNHDINEVLNQEGIAIRVGSHCAMPLMQKLNLSNGTLRASTYIYNSNEDIDKLVDTIKKAIKIFS